MNGGPNGDLFITFIIEQDPRFRRQGDDLYTTATIDLYTAILGGEAMVNTLDGKVKLKINPETQSGTKTRLKGKGYPVYKQEGQHGDLYVTIEVKLPTNLTEKEKELFRQLADQLKTNNMEKEQLIPAEIICTHHKIDTAFIFSLESAGLIEISRQDDVLYIHPSQLSDLEKFICFHYS